MNFSPPIEVKFVAHSTGRNARSEYRTLLTSSDDNNIRMLLDHVNRRVPHHVQSITFKIGEFSFDLLNADTIYSDLSLPLFLREKSEAVYRARSGRRGNATQLQSGVLESSSSDYNWSVDTVDDVEFSVTPNTEWLYNYLHDQIRTDQSRSTRQSPENVPVINPNWPQQL